MRPHAPIQLLLDSSLAWRSARVVAAISLAWSCAFASAAELPAALLRPPCVACRQPAEATRQRLSESDWSRLEKGEVVIVDRSSDAAGDGGGGSARGESEAAVIVPRPPSEVWAVLIDFESRPKIFPDVTESHLERVDANRAWIRQAVDVFWTKIRYTLIASLDPAHGLITFVLDRSSPHDIRDDTGSWQVLPHGDSSTLLVSRHRVDTGRPVPGGLEHYLVKRSLPKMMRNLRQEVERRAGDGSVDR